MHVYRNARNHHHQNELYVLNAHAHIICSVSPKKSLNCKKTFLHLFSIHTYAHELILWYIQTTGTLFLEERKSEDERKNGSAIVVFAHCYLYCGWELCELNKKRSFLLENHMCELMLAKRHTYTHKKLDWILIELWIRFEWTILFSFLLISIFSTPPTIQSHTATLARLIKAKNFVKILLK